MEKILDEINRVLKIQYSGVRPDTNFEKGYTTAYENLKKFIIIKKHGKRRTAYNSN